MIICPASGCRYFTSPPGRSRRSASARRWQRRATMRGVSRGRGLKGPPGRGDSETHCCRQRFRQPDHSKVFECGRLSDYVESTRVGLHSTRTPEVRCTRPERWAPRAGGPCDTWHPRVKVRFRVEASSARYMAGGRISAADELTSYKAPDSNGQPRQWV